MFCQKIGVVRAVMALLLVAGVGCGAFAQQATSLIDVVPLARSAAFTFRLDQVAQSRYVKDDFGPLYQPSPVATLEWRRSGESAWKKAQPFVRVQADRFPKSPMGPDPRMGTMLFGLREGETYEYRVGFFGLGFPTTPITGQFRTLTSSVPTGASTVIPIVVSPTTTSAELRAAFAAALTGTPAQNGGKIIELRSSLGAGVRTVVRAAISSIYVNGPWSWGGTKDAWLTLRTAAGHKIIFDGSDPKFDVKDAGNWLPVTDSKLGIKSTDGVFVSKASVPRPATVFYEPVLDSVGIRLLDVTRNERFLYNWVYSLSTGMDVSRAATIKTINRPAGSAYVTITTETDPYVMPGDSVTISGSSHSAWNRSVPILDAARDDAKGLYTLVFQSPDGWTADSATGGTVTPAKVHSAAQDRIAGNGGFFAWTPDAPGAATGKLYVRLHNGRDPNTVYMKLPGLVACLDIWSTSFLKVEGLDIRYFVWFGGIGLMDVSDLVIQNCTLRCLTMYIGHKTSAQSFKRRIIIKGNRMEERGLAPDPTDPSFPAPQWTWVKASKQEQIGVPLYGRGVSLIDNTIAGMCNGTSGYVGTQSMSFGDDQRTYPEAWEIDGNTFLGIADDSIEPEQWAVNYAVTCNTFRACYKGISLAPATGGPYFVLRNRWLGRGEFAALADKQAFLKMGNDDPGDPAYKFIAQNTIVNINANQNGVPLVGLANSGSTYNHYYFNNYVASDGYPVDFGYGFVGYPHIFDGNRYRSQRFSASIPNYDHGFAIARIPLTQGDPMPGSDHRTCATFDDWQRGRANGNSPNWPGYDGNVPQTPRIAQTAGVAQYPAETVAWLHDPHGSFSEGAPELAAPFTGDFRPNAGSALIGAGIPLANISYDCGPGWAAYEESGRPTVGALVAGSGSSGSINEPPTLNVDSSAIGIVGKPVSVSASYLDWDGSVASVTAAVANPIGSPVPAEVTKVDEGISTIVFTPLVIGPHTLTVTAKDDRGAVSQANVVVTVVPDEPVQGELLIAMSTSKSDPRPGEPVVFTITVSNPTNRTMKDTVIRQAIPTQMDLNTASLAVNGSPLSGSFVNSVLQVTIGSIGPGEKRTITVTAFVK